MHKSHDAVTLPEAEGLAQTGEEKNILFAYTPAVFKHTHTSRKI